MVIGGRRRVHSSSSRVRLPPREPTPTQRVTFPVTFSISQNNLKCAPVSASKLANGLRSPVLHPGPAQLVSVLPVLLPERAVHLTVRPGRRAGPRLKTGELSYGRRSFS